MNNDLISREALKKAISNIAQNILEIRTDGKCFFTLYEILHAIDNAPTITNGTYEQGFRVGAYGRIRPKGEWIVNNYGEHICSNCGHYALSDEISDNEYKVVLSDFCPNCGADMRQTETNE